jgi:nitric oxide reductase NorQ protein
MSEMKESCLESLRYIATRPEGKAKISELKEEFSPPKGHFEPRVIGALCAGTSPNCRLEGAYLVITEFGKKNLARYEGKEISPPSSDVEPPKPPKPKPETIKTGFVETNQEVAIMLEAIKAGKNILCVGPTGSGKSFLIEEISGAQKKKLWTVNCDVELDKTELVGHYEIITDEKGQPKTQWVKGILPMAMENGDYVVLDEVNMARPEVMSVLHQALDHRRTLTIKEHGNEEVKAHPEFRIFGSMNAGYAGTAELNYAFRRRFQRIITMDYLSAEREKRLIINRTGIDDDDAHKLVSIGRDTRKLEADGKLSHSVSTAHLLEFAEMLKLGTFSAMECARVTLCVDDDEGVKQDIMNIVRSYY